MEVMQNIDLVPRVITTYRRDGGHAKHRYRFCPKSYNSSSDADLDSTIYGFLFHTFGTGNNLRKDGTLKG